MKFILVYITFFSSVVANELILVSSDVSGGRAYAIKIDKNSNLVQYSDIQTDLKKVPDFDLKGRLVNLDKKFHLRTNRFITFLNGLNAEKHGSPVVKGSNILRIYINNKLAYRGFVANSTNSKSKLDLNVRKSISSLLGESENSKSVINGLYSSSNY